MYALVAEKGYDKASMNQVCAAVGVSKPALYYYFASKEELFLDMVKSLYPVLDPDDTEFASIDDRGEYYSYLQRLTKTTIEAFAAVLKHGADIGALPPRFDVENAAQYLYVITSGFSTLVAQNADVDAVAVWNKAVDLLLLDAKRQ